MHRHSLGIAHAIVVIAIIASASGVLGTPVVAHAQLRGDSAAVAMARTMMQRMGGRAHWGTARTLRVVEEVHAVTAREPHSGEGWRALDVPELWWRSRTAEGERSFARTATGGWDSSGATVTSLSASRLRRWLGYWPRNIYVMYHRLAAEDSLLEIAREGERGFVVLDVRTGDRLCAFEVTAAGDPFRWSAAFGLEREEWIYGPMTDFGPIRMPAWGVRVDDGYRFYYREVTLSRERIPVSLEAPRR